MNLFKTYKNKKTTWLSSFSESRRLPKFLPFIHSFSELRENKPTDEPKESEKVNDPVNESDIHSDYRINPLGLTKEHIRAIQSYTGANSINSSYGHGSSKNMNGYLFNRAGFNGRGIQHHSPEAVDGAIKTLSSAFDNDDNTNGKEITTYSAVPHDIGHMLMNSEPGTKHVLPGFTSTSTELNVAHAYGYEYRQHTNSNGEQHTIEYTLKPHTGMSLKKHSDHPYENEILLNHGAHIEYIRTEHYRDGTFHHHVIVHPTRNGLSDYPHEYDPKRSNINVG